MTARLRRGGLLTAAALAAAVLLPAAPATARDGDFALSRPADDLWRWAFVERATLARARPDAAAPAVARLSTRTPERTPEALPLLARRNVDGALWVRVRLPDCRTERPAGCRATSSAATRSCARH